VSRPNLRRRPLLALVAVAAVVAGLVAPSALSRAPTAAAADPEFPYQDASLPIVVRVDDLVGRMTTAEKIGQMTQTERYQVFDDPSPITTYGLGSILSGGGSTPTNNNPKAWADMVDRFQAAALKTRLGIPLLYGIDSVHGDGNLYGATVFPHNIGLGATRNPALVRDVAHVTAEETRATGPQWTFSPCVCAARDDRWGRTYESFGEDPALVEQMETVIDGYQGRPAAWPTTTGCSRPRSTTRATVTRSTAPRPATTRSTRASRWPATRSSGTSRCGSTCPRCRTTTSDR
jgi:beta-glucosidase